MSPDSHAAHHTLSFIFSLLVAQSCPTLCNPVDYSLPGSSVHGILQARILRWVAILFYRGSSRSRDRTPSLPHCRKILYCLSHQDLFGMRLKDHICLKHLHGSWLSVVLPWSPVTFINTSLSVLKRTATCRSCRLEEEKKGKLVTETRDDKKQQQGR